MQKINKNEIVLPNIQRGNVWTKKKELKLFKSLWAGYPIGYLILWRINEQVKYIKKIGKDSRLSINDLDTTLHYLLIDGQQRLTAIYNAFTIEDYLFFNPKDGSFSIKPKKESISIKSIFNTGLIDLYEKFMKNNSFLNQNAIKKSMEELKELKNYQIPVLVLTNEVNTEKASDIFCLINSTGTRLTANDFLISLLALYAGNLRIKLENFIEMIKNKSEKTFNVFWQPKLTEMIRALSWVEFYRDPLNVFNGFKNETKDEKDSMIKKFTEGVEILTNQKHWLNYIEIIESLCLSRKFDGGYNYIYGYVLYTLYIKKYGYTNKMKIIEMFKPWILFTILTSRYAGSQIQTRMRYDINRFFPKNEDLNAMDIKSRMKEIIDNIFTNDYWEKTLPYRIRNAFEKKNSILSIYLSALITFNAPSMFSTRTLMSQSSIAIGKNELEFHHLYPVNYLKKLGLAENNTYKKQINCIANFALMDSITNKKISDSKPSSYFEKFLNEHLAVKKLQGDEREKYIKDFYFYFALYDDWDQNDKNIDDYFTFLDKRSKKMSKVIKKLFVDENNVQKYEELLNERIKSFKANPIKPSNTNTNMDKVKENELLKKRNNMSVKQTIKPSFYVQINHHSRKLNNEEKFFEIIKKNDIIDNKYINRKWPMYEKNILVKAFYLYLYEGKSVGVIDADLLGIYKKTHDGWYTWHLLKLYHIETSKVNRGILKKQGISEDDARKLIAEFVSDNEITENYPYF